jgi:hypothetical protein
MLRDSNARLAPICAASQPFKGALVYVAGRTQPFISLESTHGSPCLRSVLAVNLVSFQIAGSAQKPLDGKDLPVITLAGIIVISRRGDRAGIATDVASLVKSADGANRCRLAIRSGLPGFAEVHKPLAVLLSYFTLPVVYRQPSGATLAKYGGLAGRPNQLAPTTLLLRAGRERWESCQEQNCPRCNERTSLHRHFSLP